MIKQFSGEHRWLSNFSPCEVVLDGEIYPTTENAYQAAKTLFLDDRVQFQSLTPGQAKRAGRDDVLIREDWDLIKITIMGDLQEQKYAQEPYKTLLKETGDCIIEEGNTWGDTFWGICNEIGYNHLGRIIMRVREDLC